MVVPRIERAVEELDGDPSDVAAQARVSLALVVDEIEGLAAGPRKMAANSRWFVS